MRDDRPGIGFLHLGRQVTLCDPGRSEPQFVGQFHLLEEVGEHGPLVRHVAVHLGLADGEEDVELHGPATLGDMKRLSNLLLLLVLTACATNPYGLTVLDRAAYEKTAAADPEKQLIDL